VQAPAAADRQPDFGGKTKPMTPANTSPQASPLRSLVWGSCGKGHADKTAGFSQDERRRITDTSEFLE
jgi:hypothetical protein